MFQFPRVIAIILTWNQKEDTLRCLRSFRVVEYPNLLVILVDNGSNDGTRRAVKEEFPEVQIIANPVNAGVAGGRNIGIDFARKHLAYDYLLFIDNDTVVTRDFLRTLVQALEANPSAGIATPKVHLLDNDGIIDNAGGGLVNFYTGRTFPRGHGEVDRGQYDGLETPPCFPAGISLVRRAVIEKCQGFDLAFNPYGPEDLDFSLRAKAHGFTFRFVPKALVYHRGTKSGFKGYSPEYAAIKGRNLRRFMKRHATWYQWLCFNALLPVLGLRTIAREIARGNVKAPFHLIRGYWRANRK